MDKSEAIQTENTGREEQKMPTKIMEGNNIAIIGMSCRFPGAKTIDEFWQNLRNGVESVTFFSDRELLDAGLKPESISAPNYVKAGCVIEDIDLFDHAFFGYSPKEAEMIDPQQRLFLECSWESFEDAGYVPQTYEGLVGVFGGTRISSYFQQMVHQYNQLGTAASFQSLLGNDKDYLTNRVAYKLNLKGPSITVQTACSTSLVAVHMASESLLNGECDMALAGGVAISVPQRQGYFYQEDMIFSPDGHCRAFDANGQGLIGGNGIGMVLLKPLNKALQDNDNIYAVIVGSSVNNDGSIKAGYTAPSIQGQTMVISEALAISEIDPEKIGYVEAHGTGTPLGDPIEIEALTRAFRAYTDKAQYCAIGSVKTNIGHLDTAAGIASLIKTALILKHGEIPPSLHFERPNPKIDFENSPFYVNTALKAWNRNGSPRTAGVSSFGIGGTNAHVIMQEKPKVSSEAFQIERKSFPIPISAHNEEALRKGGKRISDYLKLNPETSLVDLAYTLSVGRAHYNLHRRAFPASSLDELQKLLDGYMVQPSSSAPMAEGNATGNSQIAFLFTGQGSQYMGMGQALYYSQPAFKLALDRCAEILDSLMDKPLLSLLFSDENGLLVQTRYTQPTLFSLEYALAEMWKSWGIQPSAVLGHSVGEYVAACIAGVFGLEDALKLIAKRGELMHQLPQNGAMLAVFTGEDRIHDFLAPFVETVSIAAVNGPEFIVISGLSTSVDLIKKSLSAQQIESQPLVVSHAFHSPLVEPMIEDFKKTAEKIEYHPPNIKLVGNVTGRFVEEKEITDSAYWCKHIRLPVRFEAGMKNISEANVDLFLEIGPHPVLSGMAKKFLTHKADAFNYSLRRGDHPWTSVAQTIANLYNHGINIDWDKFFHGSVAHRISLPTYAFTKKRHWFTDPSSNQDLKMTSGIDVIKALTEEGNRIVESKHASDNIEQIKDQNKLLNRLCGHHIGQALKRLGAFEDPDEYFSVETFLFQTPIMPRYGQLLHWVLEGLHRAGLLEKKDNEYRNLQELSIDEMETGSNLLAQGELFREEKKCHRLLLELCDRFDEMLSGALGTDNILLESTLLSVQAILCNDFEVTHHYNEIVEAMFEQLIRTIPQTSAIRVLELGCGLGGLIKSLSSILPVQRTTYHMTAKSSIFKDYNAEFIEENPFVSFHVVDVQQDFVSQGLEAHQYDIAVTENVLYSSSNISKSLQNIHSALAPEGILILRESTMHQLAFDVAFGPLVEEIEDNDFREECAALTIKQWCDVLAENGFKEIEIIQNAAQLGSVVIVAKADKNEAAANEQRAFASTIGSQPIKEDLYSSLTFSFENGFKGKKIDLALPVYEIVLNQKHFPILKDYSVFENQVAPMCLFEKIADTLANEMKEGSAYVIKDLELFDPLVIQEENANYILQVMCTHKTLSEARFKGFGRSSSVPENIKRWNHHFSYSIVFNDKRTGNPKNDTEAFSNVDNGVNSLIPVTKLYESIAEKGIVFGSRLHGLVDLWGNEAYLTGKISASGLRPEDRDTHSTKAVVIESCIQMGLYFSNSNLSSQNDSDKQYFPTKISAINLEDEVLDNEGWIHLTQTENSTMQDKAIEVTCLVFNKNKLLVGELSGITFALFSNKEVRNFLSRNQLPLSTGTQDISKGENSRILTQIITASENDRKHLLEKYLLSVFARILRMDGDEISPEDDFIQLGLDSLQFLELNQTLTRDLQVKVSAQEAFETPYISALVNRINTEFDKDADPGSNNYQLLDPLAAIGGELVVDTDNRYESFPLTNVQYAYWIGRSGILDLGNVSCHFYFEIERESLNINAFNKAWNRVVRRHDMLRSVIMSDGCQKILKSVPFYAVAENDYSHCSPDEIEACLSKIRHEKSHQVISSDEWPLFDICVSTLPGGNVRMHFSIELLNADVMSIQIIFSEVDAFLKDPQFEPEPLRISFRDYVLAENRLKETALYQRCKDYWLEQIQDMPPAPALPLSKSLSEVENQRFTSLVFELDTETWANLKRRAKQRGLTPSGVLLTAYSDILATWSKNSEFIISLAQFNRIPFHPDVYNITGDFTSILIMAIDAKNGDSFERRAKIVQSNLWSHLEHRYFDGVEVIRELSRGKRKSNEALIPVVFTSILGVGEQSEELYPWAVLGDVGYFVSQTPQVWLDNQVSERNGRLVVSWDVIEEVFPDGMLDDMFDAYSRLLHSLADDDQCWIRKSKDLLPIPQKSRRSEYNQTSGPISDDLLHALFLKKTEQRPTATALITPDIKLTYQELALRAHHVALAVSELCSEKAPLVALVMEKGWEQVCSVLGILQAGKAYLPIEPTLPDDRLDFLLEDSGVNLILTQAIIAGNRHFGNNRHVISVDGLDFNRSIPSLRQITQKPTDMAYVIYTSGSTGKPKGVMIDHQGAVNTILDINRRFDVGPDDKVLGISALNFDLSVYDIFGTLAAGGAIVFPDAGRRIDPGHWLELIKQEKITIWNTVPALMQLFVELFENKQIPPNSNIRLSLLSGDWIPLDLPERIQKVLPNSKTISLGGATEASIWSILYPVDRVNPNWKSVPYGYPMSNQQVYVLDHDLEDRPEGVPGQLYIGGIGLSLGYWKDEEKTASAFVHHPKTRERIYKTGDLGVFRSDGVIEFLGREDFQVKIHGHRIELGEIESVLKQYSKISDAVVAVYENEKSGTKGISAYYLTGDKTELEPEIVQAFLLRKLPAYMLPLYYIQLEAFPLSANGKIDRKRLPEPNQNIVVDYNEFEEPIGEIEVQLAEMWAETIGRERVGRHDDFFAIGGDSLIATRLVLKIKEKFKVKLSLPKLFDSPTIAKLAERIDQSALNPDVLAFELLSTVDLEKDADLDESIKISGGPVKNIAKPERIFMTGGSGFLGAFLLNELLSMTSATIYCLVRAETQERGKKRLLDNLENYGLTDQSKENRIIAVVGDLSKPLLGMSQRDYDYLSDKVDVIYHSGALVHFHYSYDTMKPHNVEGTKEILRFASNKYLKPVHYVSTTAVFSDQGVDGVRRIKEDDNIEDPGGLYTGYAQSKWVAEKLVWTAGKRGIPISIYRPGLVTGDSIKGACDPDDFIFRILKGCLQLKCVPKVDVEMDALPVDFVSKAIVRLSMEKRSLGHVFHLINDRPIKSNKLLNWIRQKGYTLEEVSWKKWREQLMKASRNNSLYPFLHLFPETSVEDEGKLIFELNNTLKALKRLSIVYPEMDDSLLELFYSHLTNTGFIEKGPNI